MECLWSLEYRLRLDESLTLTGSILYGGGMIRESDMVEVWNNTGRSQYNSGVGDAWLNRWTYEIDWTACASKVRGSRILRKTLDGYTLVYTRSNFRLQKIIPGAADCLINLQLHSHAQVLLPKYILGQLAAVVLRRPLTVVVRKHSGHHDLTTHGSYNPMRWNFYMNSFPV
jgi:hypothetical protein